MQGEGVVQGAEKSKVPEIGMILEGGGMRAGFVAGALMALADHGITAFNTALAVSASVPTLAYFVAGQRLEMERVWREELNTPRLVRYRNIPAASLALAVRRPVLDIDYLVYNVFREKYPLDMNRLLASRTNCLFAVTRAPECCLTFLGPEDADIYDIFKAALAVPGAYPEPACVGGCEYVDGGTVNPLPARRLLEYGVKRIVAVLSSPLDCKHEPPNVLERIALWRYLKRYDWMLDKLLLAARTFNDEVDYLERMAGAAPPRSLIVSPEKMPPAGFITRDGRKINKTVDIGYRTAETRIEEIRAYMDGN